MKTPGTNADVACFKEEAKAFSKETENMTKNQLEILELKENLQILPKPLILKVKSFPGRWWRWW